MVEKRMKKKYTATREKKNKIFSINIIIVCLLAVCLLTGETGYAKYITGSVNNDDARVARFAVSTAVKWQYLELDETNDWKESYHFSITNRDKYGISEVAILYHVIVVLPDTVPFPDWLHLTLNRDNHEVIQPVQTKSDGKFTYTFQNAGSFAAGIEATHVCYLQFVITEDFMENIDLVGITVYVIAEQAD